jgi:uncharacterized cofD-like protein
MPKVAVIGGGSGIFPVTSALKHLPVSVSTIIAVSDSGGSTGRLRDEFGFQPIGDLRQSLAALAEDETQEWIRKLLLYRFDRGKDLKGHNLGNLILTALQDMTGDTDEALQKAASIFRIEGDVIPATKENVDLKVVYEDGSVIVGEDHLDAETANPKKIDHIELVPEATLNPRARAALEAANFIIIGPGDFYASILPALAPKGTTDAFANTKAEIIYIMNLMTRQTQTKDMTASDHVAEIENFIGTPVSYIIMNNEPIPSETLERYAKHHEYPVIDDISDDGRLLRAPLLSASTYTKSESDTAHRSILRHDSQKLIAILEAIIK